MKAVRKFQADKHHPSLRLKKLEVDRSGRLYSMRAAQDLRILLVNEGDTYVLLEAGHRQHIYDKVGKKSFTYNATTGFVGLIGEGVGEGEHHVQAIRLTKGNVEEGKGVLDHWGEKDLLEAGFSREAIGLLRSAKSEEQLCNLASNASLSIEDFDRAVDLFELTPEEWRTPQLLVDANEAELRLRRAITDFGAAHGLSAFYSPAEVEAIASAPIEDWMIFSPSRSTRDSAASLRRARACARCSGNWKNCSCSAPHR